MDEIEDIWLLLSNAPDSQISADITALMKTTPVPTPDDIIDIMDLCSYTAGASMFAMVALEIQWRAHGGDENQAAARRFNRGEQWLTSNSSIKVSPASKLN